MKLPWPALARQLSVTSEISKLGSQKTGYGRFPLSAKPKFIPFQKLLHDA